jgi:hypothetical protein
LVRLAWFKKLRTFPVLFSYLAVSTGFSIVGLAVYTLLPRWTANDSSIVPIYKLYGKAWVVSQPLFWTLSFCILVEVYVRILDDFKGLQKLGHLTMYLALGLVGCLYLAMVFVDSSASTWSRFWVLQERGVYIGLTVLCLALLSFAWFFKLRVPRNVRVVFGVFGLIFAAQAGFVVMLLQVGFGLQLEKAAPLAHLEEIKRLIVSMVGAVSMLAGTVLFSSGEKDLAVARPILTVETEAAMSQGLQGFNSVLLKVLRS